MEKTQDIYSPSYAWFNLQKSSDYYYMMELICRQVGYDHDDIEILVAKAGIDLRPLTDLDSLWGRASEIELAGIEMHCINDFAASFATAVKIWVPEGIEYTPVEDFAPFTPLTGVSVGEVSDDFLFAFDARMRIWHLRYRWGETTAEVEEAFVPAKKESEYVAYMLEHPNKWIPCTDILPTSGPSELRSAVAHHESCADTVGQRSHHNNDDEEREQWSALRHEVAELVESRKQARADSDAELEKKIETKLNALTSIINSRYDKYGRPRESLTTELSNAANRVRNAIIRFTSMFSPTGKYPRPHFYQHLMSITVRQGSCFYIAKPPMCDLPQWRVIWPSKTL